MEQEKVLEKNDWEIIESFLPKGWREKGRELWAVRRCRKFSSPDELLRVLFIHLAEGCSLRETSVRVKEGGIGTISDVALLKRLKSSGEWFRWMAEGVMRNCVEKQPSAVFGEIDRLRLIDGTTVEEPGATGTTWRIHYSIQLPSLGCDEVIITGPDIGESFELFNFRRGEIVLGDRGYCRRKDIARVVASGADVIVRGHLATLPLKNGNGDKWNLLNHLKTLRGTKAGDWDVCFTYNGKTIKGRICALKKSKEAAEISKQKALKDASRKGHRIKQETLDGAEYVFVFTTLDRKKFSPITVLEMYRGRWQIEIAFKRLKSIIGLGHLKKTDLIGAKAWIHGKLLVAFLIEALISAGERFFPWGYPIGQEAQTE